MILTIAEHENGELTAASATALTMARGLDDELHAVVFGADDVPALSKYGVAVSHRIDTGSDYSPELWGEALSQLIAHSGADSVLSAATDRGNELMAQVAARRNLPLASGCVEVSGGPTWSLTRIRSGGVLLEDAELEADVKLATVLPTAADPAAADSPGEAGESPFTPELDGVVASRLVDRTERSEGVGLATARLVVSGGRGVGSAEGFASLEELAGLLGGAVGCSRVATNNGWRPHSDQVGQTGTKIAPDLYVACGISGATQHWVGCMDSKAILAINTDPAAPLVTRATYAVVGEVHEVLPAVIEEVRKRVSAAQ